MLAVLFSRQEFARSRFSLRSTPSLCAFGRQGYCAFFAAGLSLITVESELRLANRDLSNELVRDFYARARRKETGDSS